MKDALGFEKPGTLIEVQGTPYVLLEGWNLKQVKADAKRAETDRPASFRCRHGWHNLEVIGTPEPLPSITESGDLLAHFMYIAFHSGDLKRCSRCGKLAIGQP